MVPDRRILVPGGRGQGRGQQFNQLLRSVTVRSDPGLYKGRQDFRNRHGIGSLENLLGKEIRLIALGTQIEELAEKWQQEEETQAGQQGRDCKARNGDQAQRGQDQGGKNQDRGDSHGRGPEKCAAARRNPFGQDIGDGVQGKAQVQGVRGHFGHAHVPDPVSQRYFRPGGAALGPRFLRLVIGQGVRGQGAAAEKTDNGIQDCLHPKMGEFMRPARGIDNGPAFRVRHLASRRVEEGHAVIEVAEHAQPVRAEQLGQDQRHFPGVPGEIPDGRHGKER